MLFSFAILFFRHEETQFVYSEMYTVCCLLDDITFANYEEKFDEQELAEFVSCWRDNQSFIKIHFLVKSVACDLKSGSYQTPAGN